MIQALRKKLGSTTVSHVPVGRMVTEEFCFRFQSIPERLVPLDILLRSVDDTNKPKLQRVNTTRQNLQSICPMVHQIELRENTDCALSLRIDLTSKLEGLRVDEILVGRRDSQNDTVRLRNILEDERSRLLLDVGRLISNRNL